MKKKNTNVRGSRNILYADYIQGGPKKGLWIDLEEKCFEKFKIIFWLSLYLYIFTSSQEVRAF